MPLSLRELTSSKRSGVKVVILRLLCNVEGASSAPLALVALAGNVQGRVGGMLCIPAIVGCLWSVQAAGRWGPLMASEVDTPPRFVLGRDGPSFGG